MKHWLPSQTLQRSWYIIQMGKFSLAVLIPVMFGYYLGFASIQDDFKPCEWEHRGNKFRTMILFGRRKYRCIGKQWCHQYLKSYVSVPISKLFLSSETFVCSYKLANTVFLYILAPSSQVQSLIYVEIGDTSLTGQTKICLRPFRSSLNSYK